MEPEYPTFALFERRDETYRAIDRHKSIVAFVPNDKQCAAALIRG